MNLTIKNKLIENTLYYCIFLFFGILISKSFGLTMPDDGWRHLAMAIYPSEVESWGRIYPNSLYQEFDPWFMWHKLLAYISTFVDNSNINIVVNSFVYSLLSLWYYLAFRKFTKINIYLIIILSIGLPMLHFRYFFLRPDILSGLFVLYFLLINNKILLVLISIIYAPFYYIFWFYFGYVGFVNLILKNYQKTILIFFALVFGFLFYYIYDFNGYLQIMQNVLNNDYLRQGHTVGENVSFLIPLQIKNSLGSTVILILLILFSLIFLITFKPKHILFKYVILFFPLFAIQDRFYYLLEPLLFVFVLSIIYNSYKIIEENDFYYFINLIKKYILEKSHLAYLLNLKVIKIIFILFVISVFISIFSINKKHYQNIEKSFIHNLFIKNDEFNNKKILFTTMSTATYMSTFLNPSGSYTPNCSIGWVNYNKENKKTYFDLLINNEKILKKDFFIFLKEIDPDYLIIDTSKTSNLVFSTNEIQKNGYSFYKIIHSKLIFRKIQ